MIRTWTLLALAAVLAAAAPPFAKAGGTPDPKLLETLGKLEKTLAAIQTAQVNQQVELDRVNAKLKAISDDVRSLRSKLNDVPPIPVPVPPGLDKAALDDLRMRVNAIAKDLAVLSNAKDRVSLFPPIDAGTSRILFTNFRPEAVTISVNDRAFRVEPGQTRPITDIPAGTVTTEVVGDTWGSIRSRRTESLLPNVTWTIEVR
jgi:hypothetical protein